MTGKDKECTCMWSEDKAKHSSNKIPYLVKFFKGRKLADHLFTQTRLNNALYCHYFVDINSKTENTE